MSLVDRWLAPYTPRRPTPRFDPRLYSPEELEQIEGVLRLLMEPRAVVAPEGTGVRR